MPAWPTLAITTSTDAAKAHPAVHRAAAHTADPATLATTKLG